MRSGNLLWLFVLFLAPAVANAQTGTISGTVTDQESGTPLPGATVLIVGTEQGTTTDLEGHYTLSNIEPGTYALSASYIGYNEVVQEGVQVTPGTTTEVSFSLESAEIGLDEVVVVGYGTLRSQDVTGSVATIDPDNIDAMPLTGVDRALTGQVAGVQVNEVAGIPGGGPRISVRGIGAIGAGSQPLYVVDGFAIPTSSSVGSNPLADIPAEDIASISVLKDASAAAIYGSRAANGVVIITTKRGRAGSKPEIQISAYTGVQVIPQRGRPDVLNAREFAQWRKESIEDRIRFEEGREPTLEDIPVEYRNPEQYGEGTNWFEEITRPAPMQNLNVSVSGGNDRIQSYVSAGFLRQDGLVIGTDFTRLSVRANVDATITNRFKVGFNLAPSYTIRHLPVQGGNKRYDAIGRAIVASPIPPVYNEDGTYNDMIGSPGTFTFANPVMMLDLLEDDRRGVRAIGTVFADLELLTGVNLRTSFNVDWDNDVHRTFNPSVVGGENRWPPVIPSGYYGSANSLNWLNENTISFRPRLGASHSLDGLLGFTVQANNAYSGGFTGNEFPDDDIRTLNAAARITGSTSQSDWGLVSYLGRINYAFRDKYLLTASLRRDGSSRFGPENRWGWFPSVAASWRLSEESFMASMESINDLKVRASYGMTGNNNIGDFNYVGAVGADNYVFGGTLASGRTLNSMGNSFLGWERSREINLGLDASLFNYRLLFTADLYRRLTEDLLLSTEVPQSSGFGGVTENRGSLENRGLELSATTTNFDGERFRWITNFNLAFNRNKVLELGVDDTPIYAGGSEGTPTHITRVGQPIGMFFGYVTEGIYQSEEEVEQLPSFPGAIPGNLRFRDINGDGQITPMDDYTIIGNPYPDFTWALTNDLTFGNWEFRTLITGAYGHDIMLGAAEYMYNIDGVFNVRRDVMNRWRSPDNPGNGWIPTTNGSGTGRVYFRRISDLHIEDGTYANLKNVMLRYNLPDSWRASWLTRTSVYLSIQNALVLSKYTNGNPEVSSMTTSVLEPGRDDSNYPIPRTFTLGLQVGF